MTTRTRRIVPKPTPVMTSPAPPPQSYSPPPPPLFDDVEPTKPMEEAVSSKSALIRKYLEATGPTESSMAGLRVWFAKNYPGISFNESGMRTTLSIQKKKLFGDNASKFGRITSATTSIAKRYAGEELTYSKLAAIKEKLKDGDEELELDKLKEQIDFIAELADEVGGFEYLEKAIEALVELRS